MEYPEKDIGSIQVVEGIAPAVMPEGFMEKGLDISTSDDKQPGEAEP